MPKSIEQQISELRYVYERHLQTHACRCTHEYCEQCREFEEAIAALEGKAELVAA